MWGQGLGICIEQLDGEEGGSGITTEEPISSNLWSSLGTAEGTAAWQGPGQHTEAGSKPLPGAPSQAPASPLHNRSDESLCQPAPLGDEEVDQSTTCGCHRMQWVTAALSIPRPSFPRGRHSLRRLGQKEGRAVKMETSVGDWPHPKYLAPTAMAAIVCPATPPEPLLGEAVSRSTCMCSVNARVFPQ